MNFNNFRRGGIKLLGVLLGLFLNGTIVTAQESGNAEGTEELYELSLEELMNITIKSASQKEESLFDAPVESYSITKEQIMQSGVTSIPEALRLSPGVIVREISNGNYDVHLRGFDAVTRYSGSQCSRWS